MTVDFKAFVVAVVKIETLLARELILIGLGPWKTPSRPEAVYLLRRATRQMILGCFWLGDWLRSMEKGLGWTTGNS